MNSIQYGDLTWQSKESTASGGIFVWLSKTLPAAFPSALFMKC